MRESHHRAPALPLPVRRPALEVSAFSVVVLGLDPRTYSRLKHDVPYYVYILASRRLGALYIGITSDLVRRVHEHRSDAVPGFASPYGTKRWVWFDVHDDVTAAIQREKNLKRWLRAWKIALIERANPGWSDLYGEIAS